MQHATCRILYTAEKRWPAITKSLGNSFFVHFSRNNQPICTCCCVDLTLTSESCTPRGRARGAKPKSQNSKTRQNINLNKKYKKPSSTARVSRVCRDTIGIPRRYHVPKPRGKRHARAARPRARSEDRTYSPEREGERPLNARGTGGNYDVHGTPSSYTTDRI